MNQVLALALATVLLIQGSSGGKCGEWKEAFRVGELQKPIDEASGLAASRRFPGRLYHVNDSGDTGRFFVTDLDGRNTRSVDVEGFDPKDVEALAVGPCGEKTTCIFIADIGDNDRNRKTIEVVIIEETAQFPDSIRPRSRLKLRYPGGRHDAEGFAVHPDGTLFVLTKSRTPRLFRLGRSEWESAGSKTLVLHPYRGLSTGGPPTDLSISDDGSRFLILTYTGAVEFDRDFKPVVIPLRFLQQQEAVTYLTGSRSFLYTTEQVGVPAWIMRSDIIPCAR